MLCSSLQYFRDIVKLIHEASNDDLNYIHPNVENVSNLFLSPVLSMQIIVMYHDHLMTFWFLMQTSDLKIDFVQMYFNSVPPVTVQRLCIEPQFLTNYRIIKLFNLKYYMSDNLSIFQFIFHDFCLYCLSFELFISIAIITLFPLSIYRILTDTGRSTCSLCHPWS